MAEIKSTLDLVMEKTKNMKMTAGERKHLREQELKRKVKSLLQKFMDHGIRLDSLKKELENGDAEQQAAMQSILKKEVLESLRPFADNEKSFDVLQNILNVKKKPLEKILEECEHELTKKRAQAEKAMKKTLALQGISGSALIPNIDKEPEWKSVFQKTITDYRKKMEAAS
ncbi:MAG: hypothetical protein ACE14T_04805 [Syntrophales bacterium]